MRRRCRVLVFALSFGSIPVAGAGQEVGGLYRITGCENGELEVPTPNLWNSAHRTRVIGQVSGNGRADQGLQCQGSVVRILDSEVVQGRTVFQIEPVVNGTVGWITELFIGRGFPAEQCGEFFDDPDHIQRCRGSS